MTDISNTCLKAFTMEKVYIVAGPEFGPLEGRYLTIVKDLCGLLTSGLHRHERLAECLRDMGFESCKMEPDSWLCPHGEYKYDHIVVYSDDLIIAFKDSKSVAYILTNKHFIRLKVIVLISYYLSCDFGRDDDGTPHFASKKFIEIMIDYYYNMFGTKPKLSFSSPL